jgi:dGTPase
LYQARDRKRLSGAAGSHGGDGPRTAFQKDYARLIHAPSFRRLQHKTQLFPGLESDFFRNRLTHSLEVAQIATGLVTNLNPTLTKGGCEAIDRDLVAFAAAAHYLGHPPFGHNGEHALDELMRQFGGFEGNAQTLRILARLEKKKQLPPNAHNADEFGRVGLDLTFRALAAVLKYDKAIPLIRSPEAPLAKGYYEIDADLVSEIKANVAGKKLPPTLKFKTVECQIMDISDDIAYSTYDLEDSLKGGFLTPIAIVIELSSDSGLLARVLREVRREISYATEDDVMSVTQEIFLGGGLWGEGAPAEGQLANVLLAHRTAQQLSEDGYARTAFTADLVGRFMSGVSIKLNKSFPKFSEINVDPNIRLEIEILKHLNYWLNIKSPRLQVVQYRGYEVVKSIFKALTEGQGFELLPTDVRDLYERCGNKDAAHSKRVICDFIAGMTDRYAVEFYGRLYQGEQSIFKPL